MFAALQRSLQDEGAAQVMRAELARMQRASSAASKNSWVPTLEELLASAAFQELRYMSDLAGASESLPDEVRQLFGQRSGLAVRILERVQPHSLHTHCWPGHLTAAGCSTDPSAGARAAGHFQRGLVIARQQQSDWWTGLLATRLAVLATADQVAAVPPAEAAALLAEADAAYRLRYDRSGSYRSCHTVLPWQWVTELKQVLVAGRASRPAIEAQSPGCGGLGQRSVSAGPPGLQRWVGCSAGTCQGYRVLCWV